MSAPDEPKTDSAGDEPQLGGTRDPFDEPLAASQPATEDLGADDPFAVDEGAHAVVGAAASPSADKAVDNDNAPSDLPRRRKRGERRRRISAKSKILDAADFELWRDAAGDGYASFVNARGVMEHALLTSRAVANQIRLRGLATTGEVPSNSNVDEIVRLYGAQALTAPVFEPILRVGNGPAGTVVVDKGDDLATSFVLARGGWQVNHDTRDKIVRRRGMTAFCDPEPGSSIALLRPFINTDDAGFILIVGWLLQALRPQGPYPILILGGEQGTGKSTVSMLLRRLVDPSSVPISAPPRDMRDFLVQVVNSRCLVFDNLSRIDTEMSDALCRIATAGGVRARAMFTDADEVLVMASRPIMLNGIGSLAERADLADRTLLANLLPIPDTQRRGEHDFWRDFEAVEPAILGALFDAVCVGLANLGTTHLERAPRLHDFARWVTACEPGLGAEWEPGSFLQIYAGNRDDARASAFENDIVAVKLDEFIRTERPEGFVGTATELLGALNLRASDELRRRRDWPYSPAGLSNRIERAAPLLRARGFVIDKVKSGARMIKIALRTPSPEGSP